MRSYDDPGMREMVSALADGQLHGADFARTVENCQNIPQLRDAWLQYHLIGDVLRSPGRDVGSVRGDFALALRARLEQECIEHSGKLQANEAGSPELVVARERGTAANDGSWRWKFVAGVASVAAVVAIAWNLGNGIAGGEPQLAGSPSLAPPTILVAAPEGTLIRDPRLDELLAAHKQFGGTSALQMPAGFLRNATFDASAR